MSNKLDPAALDELLRLEAEAVKGPWYSCGGDTHKRAGIAERMGGDVDGTRVRRHFWPESEAR